MGLPIKYTETTHTQSSRKRLPSIFPTVLLLTLILGLTWGDFISYFYKSDTLSFGISHVTPSKQSLQDNTKNKKEEESKVHFGLLQNAIFKGANKAAQPISNLNLTPQVLFIGNSYTYGNNLPQIFANLANSAAYNVSVDSSTGGGWRLYNDHAFSAQTQGKINGQSWNYVIMQEQSTTPIYNPGGMELGVSILDALIKAQGAESLLFMTWGRRNDVAQNSFGYANYEAMQADIRATYMQVGQNLSIRVSPVGLAWQKSTSERPDLNLWADDGSHPNLRGSYLAACVFYATIFQKSPQGLSYTAGLPTDEAHFFQRMAKEVALPLTLIKSINNDMPTSNDVLTYTITLHNSSVMAATGVVITDALDSHTNFGWASNGGLHHSGVVTWSMSSISPNQTITRSLQVTVSDISSDTHLTNIAIATSIERFNQAQGVVIAPGISFYLPLIFH